VSQVQASMASLNQTCNKLVAELEAEQLREEDEARRWKEINARRAQLGTNDRSMAFGNIKNVLDKKVA